jgi:hypothetical protein
VDKRTRRERTKFRRGLAVSTVPTPFEIFKPVLRHKPQANEVFCRIFCCHAMSRSVFFSKKIQPSVDSNVSSREPMTSHRQQIRRCFFQQSECRQCLLRGDSQTDQVFRGETYRWTPGRRVSFQQSVYPRPNAYHYSFVCIFWCDKASMAVVIGPQQFFQPIP